MIIDFDTTKIGKNGLFHDQLDVSQLRTSAGKPVGVGDVNVGDDGLGNAKLTFPEGETITLLGVSHTLMQQSENLCAAGIPRVTREPTIATPSGPRKIGSLREGSLVQTLEYGALPVLWIERKIVGTNTTALPSNTMPVRLRAGSFGNQKPQLVAPQQCIRMKDNVQDCHVLVRAKHLAEETDLASFALGKRQAMQQHILLEKHATICIEGIPCASFYPGPLALKMLEPLERWRIQCHFPKLKHFHANTAYGPRLASVMTRRDFVNATMIGALSVEDFDA